MGTGKNKCLNSNLGLCMCIHEQNRKHQFVMVDPVMASPKIVGGRLFKMNGNRSDFSVNSCKK